MNDHNCQSKFECDDCSIKGICSISPVAAAMKSVIFAFLQELAFYILRIRAFGARNSQIKNNFIETFSILISNSEYSESNLNTIINNIFALLVHTKEFYQELCSQNNTGVKYYKNPIKLSKNYTVADIVKQGNKYSSKIKNGFDSEQRKGFDAILIILKSICIYMVELQGLGGDIDKYYLELLAAIEMHSIEGITQEQLLEYIEKLARHDYELVKLIFQARQEKYGKFTPVKVLTSHRQGKAILVSGSDLSELELLLEATRDKGIDIYTHGRMIIAHTLPKFRDYPHLIGHYGNGVDSYMKDFSAFPGAVFLTKLSMFRLESLYRGGVFTSDIFTASGISQVKDYNFETLIKSALLAEGFEETSPEATVDVGFCEDELNNKFEALVEKIEKNEIKNIYIIGYPDKINLQREYIEKFYSLVGKDSFVFSFSTPIEQENVVFVNVYYSCPLIYKLLDLLLPLKDKHNLKINSLFAKCEAHVIATVVNQHNFNVDKTFFGECPPNLFNPTIIEYLMDKFGICKYSSPEADFNLMTKG